MPRELAVKNINAVGKTYYVYSADGVKLQTKHLFGSDMNYTPIFGSTSGDANLNIVKTTDYVGNRVYENGSLKRVLFDGGYIEGGVFYYYITDHLGNVRVVANSSGTVEQRNHYYPYGMVFAESAIAEQGKQPYKYNGKELDQMHGLNLYDYSARQMEPTLGRFTSMDPMCEKYYDWSPYAYVNNNPMKYVDPTGMDTVDVNKLDWSKFDPENDVVMLDEATVTTTKPEPKIIMPQIYDPPLREVQPIFSILFGASRPARMLYKSVFEAVITPQTLEMEIHTAGPSLRRWSGKNEKHGDGGRALNSSEKRIQELEEQLKTASRKEREKILKKIEHIKKDATNKKKGEEHSRSNKR